MTDVAQTGGAAIEIAGLTVRYPGGDRAAVTDLSLSIPAGRFVVLLGPSGCGKSTLLRSINRLVVPDAGTIAIDGADAANIPPEELRRGIGYAIQAVGLFPHMTVGENIGIVPELLKWDPIAVRARVYELLELVRLEPARYEARYPRELSGGEAQRVGVARSLAARPRALLMDEPFGAVDAIVRTSLQDEIVRIQRTLQTTVVFVTHDVEEALRIADIMVVMKDGRIEQHGSPLDVLAHPATPFVEQLLGSKDVVRRLALVDARGATRLGASGSGPTLDAASSLRDALDLLLAGSDSVVVTDGGAPIGTIGFDDVRRAIADAAR